MKGKWRCYIAITFILVKSCFIKQFQLLSHVRLFVTPQTIAHQAPRSMGFSKQEYWSGLLFPSQRIFLTQGLNPGLLHCRQFLYCQSYREVPVSSRNMSLHQNCLAELFTIVSFQKRLVKQDQNILYYVPINATMINITIIPGVHLFRKSNFVGYVLK